MTKQIYISPGFIDNAAIDQLYSAMEMPWAIQGALMADGHKGYSLPIGGVVATDGMLVPAWVGYDIGCGMCAIPTSFPADMVEIYQDDLFEAIYNEVPVGTARSQIPEKFTPSVRPTEWFLKMYAEKDGCLQLGTLGSGNHFIEIGVDETEGVWVVVHSGSRNVGHRTATRYMKIASGSNKAKEGHYGLPANSHDGDDYRRDMMACQHFALVNRKVIMRRVETAIAKVLGMKNGGFQWSNLINRNHNHAELVNADDVAIYGDSQIWVHRKGATHAEKGMKGVIPGNMEDGAFIVEGLGSADSMNSSSHGAGRKMSRKQAKANIDLEWVQKRMAMKGIRARVTASTIDEAQEAYKNIFDVMQIQVDEGLVRVLTHIDPIVNVKG